MILPKKMVLRTIKTAKNLSRWGRKKYMAVMPYTPTVTPMANITN